MGVTFTTPGRVSELWRISNSGVGFSILYLQLRSCSLEPTNDVRVRSNAHICSASFWNGFLCVSMTFVALIIDFPRKNSQMKAVEFI